MKHHALIVGAGEIGSRHLQGLALSSTPLVVFVIDPSQDSLDHASVRWHQIHESVNHNARFVTHVTDLPSHFDLGISATTSGVRLTSTAKILEATRVKNWIFEKVLVDSPSKLEPLEKLVTGSAWVNCPRRRSSLYQQLREKVTPAKLKGCQFYVNGSQWGLACNAIHFIDLMEWLTGEALISIDSTGLDPRWHQAKRPGFSEVSGTLFCEFSGGSSLIMDSEWDSTRELSTFLRLSNGFTVNISEFGSETTSLEDGDEIDDSLPFQSRTTQDYLRRILSGKDVGLAKLRESSRMHEIFLKTLLEHYHENCDNTVTSLPIT